MAVVCIQAESWQSVPHLAHACSAAQSCLPLFDPRDYRLPCSPSMGFSRQEYWTRLLFLFQGIFLIQRWNLDLLHWQVDSLPLSHKGSPHGTGATKPKGGKTSELMDVFTALCAPVNNDHASVPSLKTLALYDFQIGMDGNPNRTPAGSRLKIQIKWSCKKKCHTISCTPLLAGCNLYQLKVAIHLDPPDSTLELGYTSFRGVGQDPVGVLAPRDRVDSQKSLLSLETPWGLRRAPI